MRRITSLALILSMLPVLPLAAQTMSFGAGSSDITSPVELSADTMTVNQTTGKAELSGNVLVGQGEMRLSADQAVIEYAQDDNSRISGLEALGNVTLVNGPDAAEAQQAVYEVGSGNITLIGDVLLAQGKNVMASERIVVNLADGTAQASGRVRSVLQPGSN
ncbi:MAG: LptA/OstA family protein [Paracoccus sp. (in: a-proteobacteria)]